MEICGVYWIVEGKVKIFSEISGGRHLLRYHPTASLNIHEPWWQLGSTGRGSFVCFDSSVLSAASSYGCRHLTIAVSRNSLGRKRKRGIFRFFFSLRYWWNVTEFATGRRICHLNASTQRMTNARNSQSSSSKISQADRNNYSFFYFLFLFIWIFKYSFEYKSVMVAIATGITFNEKFNRRCYVDLITQKEKNESTWTFKSR